MAHSRAEDVDGRVGVLRQLPRAQLADAHQRTCVDIPARPLMPQFSSMVVGCLLVHQSERYVVHGYVPLAVEVRRRVLC